MVSGIEHPIGGWCPLKVESWALWQGDSVPLGVKQRGLALILVLWVITLLSVMASVVAYTQHTELNAARNFVLTRQEQAQAEAGVIYGLIKVLASNDLQTDPWVPDGRYYFWEFAGAHLRLAVINEGSLIDLNKATPELLEGLFTAVGLGADEAASLRDAVIDWRDPDDSHQLNGVEDDGYHAAGRSFGAADAPFGAVEELVLVLGMTPQIYRAVEPALTVYSRQSTVNPAFAPPLVLAALPGMDPEIVQSYLEQREQQQADGVPISMPEGLTAGQANQAPGKVLRIRAEVRRGESDFGAGIEEIIDTTGGMASLKILARRYVRG